VNSRERVKRAISFNHPDRAPISHAVLPAAQIKYGQALDDILAEFHEDFGWDYKPNLPPEYYPAMYREGRNADAFGTIWRSEERGICGIPVECPIRNLSFYDEYHWPEDPSVTVVPWRAGGGSMAGYDDRWYARGGWITYFEQLQQLRGMENLLMDIATESREFYRLLDDMLAFNLRWIDKWTALEFEGLEFADDWGGQTSLLIKPETWRSIFKPRYAEMFQRVRSRGRSVFFHTDGQVRDILGDLIEIGVQMINCQTPLVGYDWTARNLRGRVAFRTDIDRQHALPYGSRSEIREEVHRTFEACGSSQGGIIACGSVGPDVPLENVRAMYEAFAEYGTYA
jgi:uroporphyrinogen decarboxylase